MHGQADRQVPRRLIIAHLGNGASVTALIDGCSVDMTMGLTPCGNLIMGNRSCELDPEVIFRILKLQVVVEHRISRRTVERQLWGEGDLRHFA